METILLVSPSFEAAMATFDPATSDFQNGTLTSRLITCPMHGQVLSTIQIALSIVSRLTLTVSSPLMSFKETSLLHVLMVIVGITFMSILI